MRSSAIKQRTCLSHIIQGHNTCFLRCCVTSMTKKSETFVPLCFFNNALFWPCGLLENKNVTLTSLFYQHFSEELFFLSLSESNVNAITFFSPLILHCVKQHSVVKMTFVKFLERNSRLLFLAKVNFVARIVCFLYIPNYIIFSYL